MKKKNIKIVYISIAVLLGIFLLNYLGVFDKISPFAATSTGTDIVDSGKQRAGYNCPSTVSYCNVKGGIECTQLKGGENYVVFRGNTDYNRAGFPIAFAIPDTTTLKSYEYKDKQISTSVCSGNPLYTVTNPTAEIYWYNNQLVICHDNTARIYEVGGSASTSQTLVSGETCNVGKIRCGGELSGYSCSGEFSINNVKKDDLSYSSLLRGGIDETAWFKINPNDKVSIVGGDDNYVQFEAINQYTTCFSDYCEGELVRKCVDNRPGDLITCDVGETCIEGTCSLPFITRTATLEKTGYTTTESIILKTNFVSASLTSGSVIIKMFKSGESTPTFSKTLINYDFRPTSNQPVSTEITNPGSGIYYITVDLSYSGKTIPIITSGNLQFRVAPEISCNLNVKGETRSELFINQPIIIELNTYQGGIGSDMDSFSFAGTTLNGNTFNIDNDCTLDTSGNAYTYICESVSSIKGDLNVKATVTKSQVSNTCSFLKRINEPRIYVSWKDTTFLCALPGTQTFYFESKDNLGNLINTVNTLSVTEPSGKILDKSSLITGSGGQYQFDYVFPEPIGGSIVYKFDLTGYSEEYKTSSTPINGVLEVRADCSPSECVTNMDCQEKYGTNYVCSNGKCKEGNRPDYLIYVIIIGAVILGIFILIIIIYSIKNKKKQFTGI